MTIDTNHSLSQSLLLQQAHQRLVYGTAPEEADVIFFLENHRETEHLQWIADLIKVLPSGSEAKGLCEYTTSHPIPEALTSLPFKWEMWGDLEDIKLTRARLSRVYEMKEAVLALDKFRLIKQFDVQEHVKRIQGLLVNAANLKMPPPIEIKDLTNWLKNPQEFQDKLAEAEKRLLPVIEKVKIVFIKQQTCKSFPIQQTALINQIQALPAKHKIYVICGNDHANPKKTAFLPEVNRLLDSLDKRRYCIIDTVGAHA